MKTSKVKDKEEEEIFKSDSSDEDLSSPILQSVDQNSKTETEEKANDRLETFYMNYIYCRQSRGLAVLGDF